MSTAPSPTIDDPVPTLIERWRNDSAGTYRTWFLWEERLKNFRSIRRGITQIVAEIEAGSFGNAYKGSSLETVVGSIAEQRQMFKGADHAFLWKPKLRIPDIYENRNNQLAFAKFLDACVCCNTEPAIIRAIHTLHGCAIKGLGRRTIAKARCAHNSRVPRLAASANCECALCHIARSKSTATPWRDSATA